MGDPGGIGPEVVVASLAAQWRDSDCRFVVFGDAGVLEQAARTVELVDAWTQSLEQAAAPGGVVVIESHTIETATHFPAELAEPKPTALGGRLSFDLVCAAIDAALLAFDDPAHVDAIVTAPINKQAWALAGHAEFPGHTELFAKRCSCDRYAMMFVSPSLRVILATTHIPLKAVAEHLTTDRILHTIELGVRACCELGVPHPRVAVLGLNPHAGEGGLLGKEDMDVISPAIHAAQSNGINATGPHPADTLFGAAAAGRHDLVVAMYHDQGLIPVKLLHRDQAVNLTVGLPIIRTSPDHGTAYDIAGRGIANPGSMRASIRLAMRLAAKPALAPSGCQQSAPDVKTP